MKLDSIAESSLTATLLRYLKQNDQDGPGPKPVLTVKLEGYQDGFPVFSVRPATAVEIGLHQTLPRLNRQE